MRVYVLGAGASVHAKYPLASALGTSLAAWIETLPADHRYRSRMNQIIGAYGGLGDFEAILADLMTPSPGKISASLPAHERPYLLSDLKEAIREHFDTIRRNPTPLYDQLANNLRLGDSVITFNYDLGIERALATAGLWDITTGYGFEIGDVQQPSPIDVLKLHGSTNWRALLFGGRTGFSVGHQGSLGERPVLFFRPDQEYLGFQDFVDPLCGHLDTAASLPVMIMPALPKEFYFATSSGQEWKPFWDGLWQRAKDVIEKAEEMFIVGYSMPIADGRARDLLLGANKGVPVTICCGSKTTSLEQEFRDRGFTNIRQIADASFTGFLARRTT